MPDQHRTVFAELPFLVVGALNGEDRPWAWILAGPPGFITSPDSHTLRIAVRSSEGDPFAANLVVGAPVGLLGIQLETRRRNRVNGTVVEAADGSSSSAWIRVSAIARNTFRRGSPS